MFCFIFYAFGLKHSFLLRFSGLTIIHTAKKQVREVVERRLMNEMGNVPMNRTQGQQVGPTILIIIRRSGFLESFTLHR